MRFDNKVAVVTASAGAGIGQATVRAFAAKGAHVVVTDTHQGRTDRVSEDIRSSCGVKALGIVCDVTDRQQVENMTEQTLDEFGRIDILVNNAGIDFSGPVVDMTDQEWERIVNVNLKGAFYCCRAVLPSMINRKSGKIINLSSVAGMMKDPPDSAAYSACKAAIMAFTRVLANEVAANGINVNAVAPGLIANPFIMKSVQPELLEELKVKHVIGRLGEPDDIANTILFLASDEAGFVCGSTFCVSGGWHMY